MAAHFFSFLRTTLSTQLRNAGKGVQLPWLALFFFLSFAVVQWGGQNAFSRLAMLRALTERGSLHINQYRDWTVDWSLSPNGNYYSNKAPGPTLLGLPLFALLDIPTMALSSARDPLGRAPPPPQWQIQLLVFFVLALPFALLVNFLSQSAARAGVPASGQLFFTLAALFGNTAAIYMSSYFGHGVAALFLLACFWCWYRARYGWAGFLFLASLLSDYSVLCVSPFLLLATLWRERTLVSVGALARGALPLLVVWAWYHTVAFGSPLHLASAYCNPAELEPPPAALGEAFRGVSFLPSPRILQSLLFGPERGILVTQPWLFLAFLALLFPLRSRTLPKGSALFLCGGLVGMLWLNGAVGGWHGGLTVGPRYLCAIFPCFALAVALRWRELPLLVRGLAWLGLGLALLFRLWIFPFQYLAPVNSIWLYFQARYSVGPQGGPVEGSPHLLLATAVALSVFAALWYVWRRKRAKQ